MILIIKRKNGEDYCKRLQNRFRLRGNICAYTKKGNGSFEMVVYPQPQDKEFMGRHK